MKLTKHIAAFFCLVLLCQCAWFKKTPAIDPITPEEELRNALIEKLFTPETRNGFWGVIVKKLGDEKPILYWNGGKNLLPASNMKLYTTAAALALLGKDFRYETLIYTTGEIGADGVLRGDVIIQGSGDPAISGRYVPGTLTTDIILKGWVAALRSKGIKSIEGNIIGDDDYFADYDLEGTWENDDLFYWYAAPSTALAINDNLYDIFITPAKNAGEKALLEYKPKTNYVTFKCDVITTDAKGRTDIDFLRGWEDNNVQIFGQIPLGGRRYRDKGCVYNPTLYAATLVHESLTSEGISISGKPIDMDDFTPEEKEEIRSRGKPLHTHLSPPITDIIRYVNKYSQNFYADMLLKTLGKKFKGEGTFRAGARVVREFIKEAGAPDADNFLMRDGSGLSRRNFVQPRQTIRLLEYMASHPDFEAFYDSLPIAGVDGTIGSRMKQPPAKNNIRAKTGFISHTRSLSGYADDRSGASWVFCFMCNNFTADVGSVDDLIDEMCQILANYGNGASE